ncbi:hypothetical protein Peur_050326 [Populus x canadensis]
MLLEILVEEALKENKSSSTFKANSFVKTQKTNRTELHEFCEILTGPDRKPVQTEPVRFGYIRFFACGQSSQNCEKEWEIITKLKNKSDFGWDDCLKMITVSKDVYNEEAHPNHDKYLNKKTYMYKAMTIVVGKDMTTGNYVKSYVDINLEENNEVQSISIENEREYEETSKSKETSSSSAQKRQHKKKNQMYKDDSVEKLSKKIGDVAFAIKSLSKNQLDVNELYKEVMKIEGFEEIAIGNAFDHLVQSEMLAKAFMVKKC